MKKRRAWRRVYTTEDPWYAVMLWGANEGGTGSAYRNKENAIRDATKAAEDPGCTAAWVVRFTGYYAHHHAVRVQWDYPLEVVFQTPERR